MTGERGRDDGTASAGTGGGTTLERGALSLVEILKVPPERQKMNHRRRMLELHYSATVGDHAVSKQHSIAGQRAAAAFGAASSS